VHAVRGLQSVLSVPRRCTECRVWGELESEDPELIASRVQRRLETHRFDTVETFEETYVCRSCGGCATHTFEVTIA